MDRSRSRLEIETAVTATARLIHPKAYYLPTYGRSEDLARPHIESAPQGMSYVIVERGNEMQRHTTTELDTLLYWIFRDITFSMAVDHEIAHRIDEQDFRIVLFQHQLVLLQVLRPEWRDRYAVEKVDRLAELGISQDFAATPRQLTGDRPG